LAPVSTSSLLSRYRGTWREFVFLVCAALAAASAVSHLAVDSLKIRSSFGAFRVYGPADAKPGTILYGSSLAYSGIDWNVVAKHIGTSIGRWPTPGSTPSEWEQFQRMSGDVRRSFVVFSAADLNEQALCDFRAEIVPLSQTLFDLWHLGGDSAYGKKVLSQYPVSVLRMAFPTVGRSDGVLTGVRDYLSRLMQRNHPGAAREAVVFNPNSDVVPDERVSDWTPGRRERRMVLERAACGSRHEFTALKRAALGRLLETASQQGPTTAVVLPTSPYYQNEFLDAAVSREFEEAVAGLQRGSPGVRWIRLDRLEVLHNNDVFFDFVHLNRIGQGYATEAFLAELGVPSERP
jgi:hypothetical protein